MIILKIAMAIIKNYTDINQSKELVEILPLESADMYYDRYGNPYFINISVTHERIKDDKYQRFIPCWSLASLLGVMICPKLEEYIKGVWDLTVFTDYTLKTPIEIQDCKDPVGACVAMIEKLHELNLL